jgi:nucleoside phosphorylase
MTEAEVNLTATLDRITFVPVGKSLKSIPWPDGLAPEAQHTALEEDGSLPPATVLVITWTAAEAMALADALTPGVASTAWTHYTKNFPKYESQLTGRSPAKNAQRLGEFHMTSINGLTVCCFHSQLHPATDSNSLPTAQLAAQIAADTGAELIITTGTAGGVGDGVALGDVNVATASSSLFTTRLKGEAWSKKTWQTTPLSSGQQAKLEESAELLMINAKGLPEKWAPRAPKIWYGEGVSTDFFAYGDASDHYGLLAYKPNCRAVDMDDAAILFGLARAKNKAAVAAIRNASDPTMPGASSEDAKESGQIYREYGFQTTASSAIATWALIAGFDRSLCHEQRDFAVGAVAPSGEEPHGCQPL